MTGGVDITQADAEAKRWAVIVRETKKHVVPIGDLVEHELSEKCFCDPRLEADDDSSVIVVHHAIDERP